MRHGENRDPMRWRWGAAIGMCVLLGPALLSVVGCSSQGPAVADGVRPVKTMVVAEGEDAHTRAFPGKVEASKTAELAFQVPGLIIELPVKEGQKVAKGDPIARVRPDEFEARLRALQGQLDQARASLRAARAGERPEERLRLEAQMRAADARLANAKVEYDRSARLVQTRSISRSEYDLAATAYKVAQEEREAARQMLEQGAIAREEEVDAREAEVRALEGRVVEAKIQWDDTTLRAPYDGVIAKRFVEPNQNVQAKQPIVQFQDITEIDVSVDVPEIVMANVRRSDIVAMTAEFGGAPGIRFPVDIREVAQAADPTTQTFRVRAAMKAPTDVNILPGMTATVTMTYRRAGILGSRFLVPISAVLKSDDANKALVWVIAEDQTVARRPVTIGEATGDKLEILDGLNPGERIAVAGVTFLRDGMKVRDLGDELGGGQS